MQFHYFSICKVNCLWFIKHFQVVPYWICLKDWKGHPTESQMREGT